MAKQLRIVISHANICMRNQVYLHSKAAYINDRKPGMIEDSFVYHYSALHDHVADNIHCCPWLPSTYV